MSVIHRILNIIRKIGERFDGYFDILSKSIIIRNKNEVVELKVDVENCTYKVKWINGNVDDLFLKELREFMNENGYKEIEK